MLIMDPIVLTHVFLIVCIDFLTTSFSLSIFSKDPESQLNGKIHLIVHSSVLIQSQSLSLFLNTRTND